MALQDLFKFESAEESRRKQLEYQKKIFPLGLEQRDMALSAIRPLISSKISDSDLLYAFISAKQKYIESEENQVSNAQKRIRDKRLTETERKCILALVLLDSTAKSPEEYPSEEDIRTCLKSFEKY